MNLNGYTEPGIWLLSIYYMLFGVEPGVGYVLHT